MGIPAGQQLSELLGRVIAFDADGRAIWPAQALADALRQQLRAQLLGHLRRRDEQEQRELAELTHSTAHPLESFDDLLHHPSPPLELLRLTKEFAKANYADAASPLAPEVCLLLYYGCIIVALMRRSQSISSLGVEDLGGGLNWVVRQPWLDQRTRRLFAEGLEHLRRGRHRWRR